MTDTDSDRKIWQPLHPSLRDKLDPEYVTFHDRVLQYVQPSETIPWDPAVRNGPSIPPGGLLVVEVGIVEDVQLERCRVRVFVPEGEVPANGWKGMLWFHGGGWVLGDINAENNYCTRVCKEGKLVVVTVEYRLAPEHPYPAALDDAIEALQWFATTGAERYSINKSKIAIGGMSAGACLSAVLTMKAATLQPPIPIKFQVLIVPVIDNTATTDTIWKTSQYAPWLTPSRMTWYRWKYLPNQQDWRRWDVSPNFASPELLAASPKTFFAISELDLLAPEAIAFAEQLEAVGVDVDVRVYKGSTHSILALDGVLSKGRQLAAASIAALSKALAD